MNCIRRREQPWDRLSDLLNGRGVPNLADELVNLELRPVHDALRQLLDPAVVRHFADIAEHPRGVGAVRAKKIERERNEFLKQAWAKCERFPREAKAAYADAAQGRQSTRAANRRTARPPRPRRRDSQSFCAHAMRMPQVEALFPAPWTAAARRMLPSPSPQFTATAMWGPVLAWCSLQLLAESVDNDHPEHTALDLFDRLRLREPFAHALEALGFEGEEAWRVAARIKVFLLVSAGVGKESAVTGQQSAIVVYISRRAVCKRQAPITPPSRPCKGSCTRPSPAYAKKLALPPALWLDPDVRWLCGVHDAEGHDYLVRESL